LDFLIQSYILYAAPRYDIKGKELLTTNEKYYIVDLGLRNITTTNKYDTDLGHKLENIVYFELFRRGGKVYVGKHNDREISAFKKLNDNYPKYLLTLDYDNANIDGIQKLNIIDWLLQ
jgi:predicted AAA+ superfamily ATPase